MGSDGDVYIAQFLLNHGANLRALDGSGGAPFRKASQSSRFDVMGPLLKAGADLNVRNKNKGAAAAVWLSGMTSSETETKAQGVI